MIVRVGWITVPAAERITSGCFLVAASAAPAKAATTRAATKLTTIARMAPRLFCADNVTGLRGREQPFWRRSAFLGGGALRAWRAPWRSEGSGDIGYPHEFARQAARRLGAKRRTYCSRCP